MYANRAPAVEHFLPVTVTFCLVKSQKIACEYVKLKTLQSGSKTGCSSSLKWSKIILFLIFAFLCVCEFRKEG